MLRHLKIKSKLVLMLILVSVTSTALVAGMAFSQSRDSLEQAAFDQVTNRRVLQANEVERYFATMAKQAQTLSEDRMTIEALAEFRVGFEQLQQASLELEWTGEATSFYGNFFRSLELADAPEITEVFTPDSVAGRYLQYHYVVGNDRAQRDLLVDAEDGSFYSRTHARFHPIFSSYIQQFGYTDLMLVTAPEGDVVYSSEKNIDFGTNVTDGPYANTSLAEVVASSLRDPEPDTVSFADFEFYRPAGLEPTSFLASPVVSGGVVVGVLVLGLPVDQLNDIMTVRSGWQDAGFGDTGQSYLVGPDGTMRSQDRLLAQDPARALEIADEVGLSAERLRALSRSESSVLVQPVATEATAAAFKTRSGTFESVDFRDQPTLASFAPLDLPGLDWVIVSEISVEEARRESATLSRNLLVLTGLLVLVISSLAIVMASVFTRPFDRLFRWASAVSKGIEQDALPIRSSDEFGRLGEAFNDMVFSLRNETERAEGERRRSDRLIQALMPETMADRFNRGESLISEDHPEVVLVYLWSNWVELAADLDGAAGTAFLSTLVSSLDDTGAELGLEKLKTAGSLYLAAAGLNDPKLDQRARAFEWATRAIESAKLYNQVASSRLSLRVAIASGKLSTGVIGREQPVLEIWGRAVLEVEALLPLAGDFEIIADDDVRNHLHDQYEFEHIGNPLGDELVAYRFVDLALDGEAPVVTTGPAMGGRDDAD